MNPTTGPATGLTPGPERTTLLVIAKEPVPGRVKTRLTPPFTPAEAAELAEAALADTLAAVARTPAARRVLVLEGRPGPWLPPGFEVIPQRPGTLDLRLAAAFEACTGPALLIGMDTPQVTPELLQVDWSAYDAWFGPAVDGGFWALGLAVSIPRCCAGYRCRCPRRAPSSTSGCARPGSASGGCRCCGTWTPPRTPGWSPPKRRKARSRRGWRYADEHARPRYGTGRGRPRHPGRGHLRQGLVRRPLHRGPAQRPRPPLPAAGRRLAAPAGCGALVRGPRPGGPYGAAALPGRRHRHRLRPGKAGVGAGRPGTPGAGHRRQPGGGGPYRPVGGTALHRSVFDSLPGEGRWDTGLLIDGNIGIGGDPAALLRRMAEVLVVTGSLIVECAEAEAEVEVDERCEVRVADGRGGLGSPFPWARVDTAALIRHAAAAGWTSGGHWTAAGRSFTVLIRPGEAS